MSPAPEPMRARKAPRVFRGDKLVVASHNPGKVREISDLLAPFAIEAISAASLNLPEPEETGTTFEANAALKALAAAKAAKLPALSDDSGLCVRALNGDPGLYSARWAGDRKNFAMAMQRVARALEEADPEGADRAAHFVCVLCLAWPDGETALFRGEVHGQVVWPPRGTQGFGYDPLFLPHGEALTFGEMDPAKKHDMSHRAHAFRQLLEGSFSPARR